MAESQPPDKSDTAAPAREDGAPIPKDEIDPDLVKLRRAPPKIGVLTSAGMVFLCAFFLLKLSADRKFGGEDDKPKLVEVASVVADKVEESSFVEISAEPMMAHAIRATKAKGDPGLRVTPVRGSNEKLWLVLDGTGWDPPTTSGRYAGRLRKLDDMPFGDSVRSHALASPRPVFASGAAVRGGFGGGTVKTVDGDTITVRDTDRVAFDVIDPGLSTVVVTFTPGTPDHAPLLDIGAWQKALDGLAISAKVIASDERDKALGQARFDVAMAVADVTAKLEGAKLWSARVEPVTRHHTTTWGALKTSPAGTFIVDKTTISEAALDLVGIYVSRPIPSDAYALIIGEVPQDYWYILPITIVVAAIGLLFLWALIRTVRRDLLPTRA